MFRPKKPISSSKTSKLSLPNTTRQMNSQLKQRLSQVKSEYKQIRDPTRIGSGKTAEFLHSRKQNQLNTRFNNRMKNLLTITKQNKKIYNRINSQQSKYSARNLNKSTDSFCSRNSRVSNNSRVSKKSQKSKAGLKRKSQSERKIPQIKQKNIKNMGISDIKQFQKLFRGDNIQQKSHNSSIKTEEIPLGLRNQNYFNPIIEEKYLISKHIKSCTEKTRSEARLPKAKPPLPLSKKLTQLPKITEILRQKQGISRY